MIRHSITSSCTSLTPGFPVPSIDLGTLLAGIGTKLFAREHSLVQYVVWSLETGLLEFLDEREWATIEQISAAAPLNESGVDAIVGVLCAAGFLVRRPDGHYGLRDVARDYLLRRSPYFIGDQLDSRGASLPAAYRRRRSSVALRLKHWYLSKLPAFRYGSDVRIRNQHARNLPACAAAVRTGIFAKAKRVLDVAGGSGAFAIPLALEYPDKHVTLTDLPEALPQMGSLLAEHALEDRVELLALNAFEYPWAVPECDGIFIGNFLHGFDDAVCRRVCQEAYARPAPGGEIWIHEMIWNENRDGPLITALWNAAMRGGGPGRQRSAGEIRAILEQAGFRDVRTIPTSGAYAVIAGRKT